MRNAMFCTTIDCVALARWIETGIFVDCLPSMPHCRLNRRTGATNPHRNADRRLGQCRRIIDSVANHPDRNQGRQSSNLGRLFVGNSPELEALNPDRVAPAAAPLPRYRQKAPAARHPSPPDRTRHQPKSAAPSRTKRSAQSPIHQRQPAQSIYHQPLPNSPHRQSQTANH